MHKRVCVIAVLLMLAAAAVAWSWGWAAHRAINAHAVELLPEPLRDFYLAHLDTLVKESVAPDEWASAKSYPGYTHYIDLDMLDNAPFAGIPKSRAAAEAKFGKEKLQKAGTLPWEIEERKEKLTRAFREKRFDDAVMESAWLAHFLADATMPLHTTADYHGRKAGNLYIDGLEGDARRNRSVHMRLEWGLIEQFPDFYPTLRGDPAKVHRIDDVLGEAWSTVHASFDLLQPVLAADRQATELDSTCGKLYYDAFDERMRPLVSQQLRRAQELAASVWLTAWEDAGKPELPSIEAPESRIGWCLIGKDLCLPRWARVAVPSAIAILLVTCWMLLRRLQLRRIKRRK